MTSIISDLQKAVIYAETVRDCLGTLANLNGNGFYLKRDGNVYKIKFKYSTVEIGREFGFGDVYKYCLESDPTGNSIEKFVEKYIITQVIESLATYK